MDPDAHIAVYYEKLAQIQSHDGQLTPVVLQQVFSEVSSSVVAQPHSSMHCIFVMPETSDHLQIQNTCLPPSTVRDWALQTYTNATDFWTFRKQVSHMIVT